MDDALATKGSPVRGQLKTDDFIEGLPLDAALRGKNDHGLTNSLGREDRKMP